MTGVPDFVHGLLTLDKQYLGSQDNSMSARDLALLSPKPPVVLGFRISHWVTPTSADTPIQSLLASHAWGTLHSAGFAAAYKARGSDSEGTGVL